MLLDSEEASGVLESMGDEAAFIQSLEPGALESVDVAIFAEAAMLREHGRTAQQLGAAVVNATQTAHGQDEPVRSPLLPESTPLDLQTSAVRVAHPVATMLALVLTHAARVASLRSVAATVLQPASENGRAALDELQQQTVSLLSFQSVPQEEFGAQAAFNLLPMLGETARNPLHESEKQIRSDLAAITGGRLPAPLLQVVQAPVFHGFTLSLFVEFEQPVQGETLAAALASEHLDPVSDEGDPPSNLSSAGQGQVLLLLRPEGTGAGTRFALWLAADNLKLRARTAVACALELTRLRPLGKVQ